MKQRMKRILSVSALSIITLCACVNQDTGNVEAKSNAKTVGLKKLEVVYQIAGTNGKSLYYNPSSKCIYTSDYMPIAEQKYDVGNGKCKGLYQSYIPR